MKESQTKHRMLEEFRRKKLAFAEAKVVLRCFGLYLASGQRREMKDNI